jgi:hypothetical protein
MKSLIKMIKQILEFIESFFAKKDTAKKETPNNDINHSKKMDEMEKAEENRMILSLMKEL